jgi:hypothetical protein
MHTPLFRTPLVFVLVGLFAGLAAAQPAEPDRYVVVTYLKTLPGQDDAYRAHVTSASTSVYKEAMTANPNLLAWSIARTMYQGLEHAGQYDYVAAAVFSGPPPEPGTGMDAVVQKATGMAMADYQKKLSTMRTVVATEVLMRRAGTGGTGTFKEGDIRVIARSKITPGMGDEYFEMMRTMGQPMMLGRVQGGEIKGWSVWSRVFPAGAATDYDVMGVTYFRDLASAIKGPDPAKGAEIFAKANPGKSYGSFINNLRDYSRMQDRSVMQVIALVER